MKVEEIEELRSMEKAATPGPWDYDSDDWVAHNGLMLIEPDAALCVAARNALPHLLAEREALLAFARDVAESCDCGDHSDMADDAIAAAES